MEVHQKQQKRRRLARRNTDNSRPGLAFLVPLLILTFYLLQTTKPDLLVSNPDDHPTRLQNIDQVSQYTEGRHCHIPPQEREYNQESNYAYIAQLSWYPKSYIEDGRQPLPRAQANRRKERKRAIAACLVPCLIHIYCLLQTPHQRGLVTTSPKYGTHDVNREPAIRTYAGYTHPIDRVSPTPGVSGRDRDNTTDTTGPMQNPHQTNRIGMVSRELTHERVQQDHYHNISIYGRPHNKITDTPQRRVHNDGSPKTNVKPVTTNSSEHRAGNQFSISLVKYNSEQYCCMQLRMVVPTRRPRTVNHLSTVISSSARLQPDTNKVTKSNKAALVCNISTSQRLLGRSVMVTNFYIIGSKHDSDERAESVLIKCRYADFLLIPCVSYEQTYPGVHKTYITAMSNQVEIVTKIYGRMTHTCQLFTRMSFIRYSVTKAKSRSDATCAIHLGDSIKSIHDIHELFYVTPGQHAVIAAICVQHFPSQRVQGNVDDSYANTMGNKMYIIMNVHVDVRVYGPIYLVGFRRQNKSMFTRSSASSASHVFINTEIPMYMTPSAQESPAGSTYIGCSIDVDIYNHWCDIMYNSDSRTSLPSIKRQSYRHEIMNDHVDVRGYGPMYNSDSRTSLPSIKRQSYRQITKPKWLVLQDWY